MPPSFPIPKTPAEVINLVREAAKAFADDPAAIAELVEGTTKLMREIAPHGRPSGSSPPFAAAATAAPALELPATPPAWWRDRQPGETPDNWLRTHYKPFIDAGLLTRGFFQRPKQDKAFSNALLAWEKEGNQLPADLYIPTLAEQNNRQLDEAGLTPGDHARIKNGRRLLQAAIYRQPALRTG